MTTPTTAEGGQREQAATEHEPHRLAEKGGFSIVWSGTDGGEYF